MINELAPVAICLLFVDFIYGDVAAVALAFYTFAAWMIWSFLSWTIGVPELRLMECMMLSFIHIGVNLFWRYRGQKVR